MERFKILYIWKSLHGHVPSMDLEWEECSSRKGDFIKVRNLIGSSEAMKTLQMSSMRIEGVKLFNSIPLELRKWDGSPDSFKVLLDKFQEFLPDQPHTETLTPGGKDLQGKSSNSISDWSRVIKVPSDFLSLMRDDNV